MKRLVTATIAALFVLTPLAQAQQKIQNDHGAKPKVEQTAKKKVWKKGGKAPSPQTHAEFKGYGKQGLRAPEKGQRWLHVDGQYLLITAATGAILSAVSGR